MNGFEAAIGPGSALPDNVVGTALLAAIEQSPVSIAIFDTGMRYLAVSRRFLADNHRAGEKVIGRTHYEVFPDLPGRWRDVHRRVLAGEECSAERDSYEPGGTTIWLRWQMKPWRTSSGAIGGAVLTSEIITEQVEEEQRLHDAQRRYRSVFDTAAVGIARVAPDGHLLEVNARFCELTGYSEEELLEMSFLEITHPEDLEQDLERGGALLRGEIGSYALEKRYIRKDGSPVWVNLTVALVRDEAGEPDYFVSVVEDVMERRKAEEDRREQSVIAGTMAERAEIAQRAARSAFYEVDVTTGRVLRSPYISEITGYSVNEIGTESGHWIGLIIPEDRADFTSTVERALQSAERFAMEYRIRRKDGVTCWVSDTGRVLRDDAGSPTAIIGLVTDISERKAAEHQLRLRTAELQTLLASAPIGFAYFDRQYRYLRINDVLAEINGVPVEAHLGRTISEVLPASGPRVEAMIDQVFATCEPIGNLEVSGETVRDPGVIRHWLTGLFPVVSDGEVTAVGIWVTEISERKAAEERELLLAREVDHRAKNLLAVVQSVVQLSRAEDAESLKAGVTGRIQSLARAHSLLAASRWEGVELSQLVSEELAPYRRDGDKVSMGGPRLTLRPSAAQSLALVLHELATNAAKYGALCAEDGRLHVRWCRMEEEDPAICILWRESGVAGSGVPERSGFGSRMIRASIERQLHGKVEYDWGEDGLTVTLEVPDEHIFSMPASEGTDSSAEPQSAGSIASPAACRVLLVEDEALIGLQLEQALEARGCEVVGVATNVDQALVLIEKTQPEGAVLDINLGGERSFPVADQLKSMGVPFIFCTGYVAETVIPERFNDVPLLRKPFDPDSIADLFVQRQRQGSD